MANLNAVRKKKIKDFLKDKGKHAGAKVDALKLTDDDVLRDEMLKLHGVTAEEYRRAKEKLWTGTQKYASL